MAHSSRHQLLSAPQPLKTCVAKNLWISAFRNALGKEASKKDLLDLLFFTMSALSSGSKPLCLLLVSTNEKCRIRLFG